MEPESAVYQIGGVVARLVHLVVLPHGVDEEGFHHILTLHTTGIDGIHQIGIVEHHLARFLGETLAERVDHVDQTGVGQILDVVHHRGATRRDVYGQLADIGCLGAINGQVIKKTLDLGEVFQLYLLDEQNVDLCHHVHGLEQVLRVVAMLLEEGIETVMQIVLEIVHGTHLRQYLLDDVLMVGKYLIERVGAEVIACHQVEKLTEGESTQVVALHDIVELGVLFLQTHHTRAGEHNLQTWIEVIAFAKTLAPTRLLEHLVDQQHAAAVAVELTGKLLYATTLEVEVVHVDIKTLLVADVEMLLGILQQECRLAHTTGALDADKTVVPVNLIHKAATDGSIDMLYKVFVSAEKGFHAF